MFGGPPQPVDRRQDLGVIGHVGNCRRFQERRHDRKDRLALALTHAREPANHGAHDGHAADSSYSGASISGNVPTTRPRLRSRVTRCSLRSAPALNARPVPRITTTRTVSSSVTPFRSIEADSLGVI